MRVLVTGGDGLLGTELKKHLDAIYTDKADLDVLSLPQVFEAMLEHRPNVVLHLAAWTDVAGAETHRQEAWDLNVVSPQHLARAAKFTGAKVVYLSSDYVFDGQAGGYQPWDAPNPLNYYGLTKMAGECMVRSIPASLIIRTSFKPARFPHPKAVEDLWTCADYVDVIAPMIVDILGYTGIHHLGTEPKTVLDLVRQRTPDVGGMRREDIKSVRLPRDVTFGDCHHWDWESC